MHRYLLVAALIAAILVPHLRAQAPAVRGNDQAAMPQPVARPATVAGKLPVKRVVLYKNGVGFFEHVGQVRGAQDVTIDFTTGQLNDVLKSLTTLDLGNGQITGVSYNSEDLLSRRLGALRLPLDETTTLVQFLNALRGARLEFTGAGAPIAGRLLSVDPRDQTASSGDRTVQGYEASVVTDTGVVHTVALRPSVHVRILDRDAAEQVSRYLALVASARDRDVRRMSIATSGIGERQLYVSYISEVPIWKTTYRLVVTDKATNKGTLQGWAIVDNTIGEDWNGVELSLVAGAPQSFIQQISQPYYARRPVVPLPQAVLLEPQTHEGTLTETPAAKTVRDYQASLPAPAAAAEMRADAPGFMAGRRAEGGIAGGVAGGIVGGLPEVPPPAEIERLMERATAAAQGRDLGDLFEYKLQERVTIPKNQSALVPIVQAGVDIEKVSLWNAASGARPRRAVWLTNSTSLTLDGGSFTVLENSTFAGEGLVQALKPGERRFVSYAVDLGVLVDTRQNSERQQVSSMQISRGVLRQRSEERERRTYTIRNEDPQPRTVVIEHPIRSEWKLMGAAKPEETSSGYYRFKVTVKPKTTETLVVEELRPIDTTYRIASITPDQVALLLRQPSITSQVEQALQRVLAKKQELAAVGAQLNERNGDIDTIFRDQERVRENLKALKGSASEKALLERYTRQLDDQENQLAALRKDIGALQQKQRTLQDELNRMIEEIRVD